MFLEKLMELSLTTGDDVGQVVGTYVAPNWIDLKRDDAEIGDGWPLEFLVTILAAVVGVGASVEFQLVTDDTAVDSSSLVVASTGPQPVANLAIGSQFTVKIPTIAAQSLDRYVGMLYVVTGATTTAGLAHVVGVVDTQNGN